MRKTQENSKINQLKQVLSEAKAADPQVILLPSNSFATELIIVSSANSRHSKAILKSIRENLSNDFNIIGTEGSDNGNWILVDFGDIVLNIFTPDTRELYALEELWKQPNIGE